MQPKDTAHNPKTSLISAIAGQVMLGSSACLDDGSTQNGSAEAAESSTGAEGIAAARSNEGPYFLTIASITACSRVIALGGSDISGHR